MDAETPEQRKARLAEVFGDDQPAQTKDDQPGQDESKSTDEWLRAQVPPHHG